MSLRPARHRGGEIKICETAFSAHTSRTPCLTLWYGHTAIQPIQPIHHTAAIHPIQPDSPYITPQARIM